MSSNKIIKIETAKFAVPQLVRANEIGWVPDFELWEAEITGDTSYIDCQQSFRKELGGYRIPKNPSIGYYDGESLIIFWKALIDSEDIPLIHNAYNGKLRACTWQNRYCVYFGTGSDSTWLHSVILNQTLSDYVVHHINGVASDNRKQNLHILPKREHDSINHPKVDERKKMFASPVKYWDERKKLALKKLAYKLWEISSVYYQGILLENCVDGNIPLAREILKKARLDINLSQMNSHVSENRAMNPHLSGSAYLDAYELEKNLKKYISSQPKSKDDRQIRLF